MTEWNAKLYDHKHQFVSNFGESLVSLLQPEKDELILDLGCGTGDLAQEISQSGAKVIGVDTSEAMIETAKKKYPHIEFSVQNAEKLSFDSTFHAIFSNAAMHWMKNQQLVIQNCYHALLPGGRFVVELGGANNIQSIVAAMKEATNRLALFYDEDLFPWTFPTKEDMHKHLQQAGFEHITIEHYERPTHLDGEDGIHNWLEMFSHFMFTHLTTKEKEAIYQECENILRPQIYKDGRWIADYWRLRFVAWKS